MVIRPARAGERAALIELQRRAALEYADTRAALLADPGLIELPAAHLAYTSVAEVNGRVLAFAVVLPRGDGDVDLDGLFVEPGHWRGGLGRRLVAAAVADRGRARKLHVIANLHALAFYRALGFLDGATIEMELSAALEMHLPMARAA